MNVNEWMLQQFSEDRCRRWLDGSKSKYRYGRRSFVHTHSTEHGGYKDGVSFRVPAPHIWSVVYCGASGGFRWTYYLTVRFYPAEAGKESVRAELKMWSRGIYARVPDREVESEMVFDLRENAPKKLNREIRRLRELLLQPTATA